MTTSSLRPEFTMNFTFKLVYTGIVHDIEISSRDSMKDLFALASSKFAHYINYNKYYIDFVIAGHKESEMAPAVSYYNLDDPLDYELGNKYKQISFYVRPMDRGSDSFVRMERYDDEDNEAPPVLEQEQGQEQGLPPPPGLVRQTNTSFVVDHTLFM